MVRKNYYIREDQIDFLNSLPGVVSEHIRIAIDLYQKQKLKYASSSPSRKGGKNE